MKNALRIVVGLAVVAGGAYGMKGCLSKADPDVRLAGRFDDLCSIATNNVETPVKGVQKLGVYLGKHLGDITGDFGDTIAMIERISNDDKHDARARVARDRILHSVLSCQDHWMEFAQAVEDNPEASKLVNRAGERFSRTIDILLGGDSLKLIPAKLEHQIEQLVR
jgi:hypothetical protein